MNPWDNTIFNLDCISGMKTLPDNYFDIIIADPPYNIGKDFGNDSDKQEFNDYIKWSSEWIAECNRLLKPSGTMFIYGFDEILAHLSVMFDINKHRWLTWHYTNKNVASYNFWQRSHESILCIWKDKPIFNRDLVREPYTEGFLKGSAGRKRPVCATGRGGHNESTYNANPNGALPRDVIKIPTLAGGASLKERIMYCKDCGKIINPKSRKDHLKHNLIIHPTQKPLELSDRLIKSCKPDGEFRVLIPFCGSGSECVSTIDNKGLYTGFELNPDYIILAQSNIKHILSSQNSVKY